MTPDDQLYRFRQRTLALAEEVGSVRAACRMMGIHHSTFYRWRKEAERYGLEMLRPRERRRPRMPNATSPFVEHRVVAFALGQPGFGPARIAAELARPKWGGIKLSPSGVWRVLRRHGLNTRREAPEPRRRLRRASRTGSPRARAGAPPGGQTARCAGAIRLLPRGPALRHQGHGLAVHRDRCRLRLHLGGAARHPAQPLGEVDLAPRPPRRLGPRCPRLVPGDRDDGQRLGVPAPASSGPRSPSWARSSASSAPAGRKPTAASSGCRARSSRSAGSPPSRAT